MPVEAENIGAVESEPVELPWTVRASEAARLGISARALRGPGFVGLRRGVHAPAGVDVGAPDLRIAAVATQLPPHACVGGWAAARLHEACAAEDGLVVFDGAPVWDVAPAGSTDARVLVCAAEESRLVHREGVRVFRSVVPAAETTLVAGVRVTSPVRTAFDLARLLPRRWAVTGVDRLLHLRLVDAAALAARVAASRGWVGVPAARRVLPLLDGAAESPQESALRLVWVDAGFPRPRGNVVVRDEQGRFLGRVDLLDEDTGVAGEYDGGVHASSDRRRSDHRRHEGLEHAGLVVVRATAGDLATEAARAAWSNRLRRAYATAARPGRARAWYAEP